MAEIILVHGYRGAPLGLAGVAQALKKMGHKVYVPTVPPFGGEMELSEYSPIAYADYLADFIKKNHLKKPVLVGHSMGSIIVAAVAARHPRLIGEKVVFLAPIASRTPSPIGMLVPLATVFSNEVVSYITTKYLYVGGSKAGFKKALEMSVRCGAVCASKRGARAAGKFSVKYAIGDFAFRKKALFLAGEKDRLNSQRKVRKVAKKYGGEVKFLAKSGHLLNYERPVAVAKAIDDFVKK